VGALGPTVNEITRVEKVIYSSIATIQSGPDLITLLQPSFLLERSRVIARYGVDYTVSSLDLVVRRVGVLDTR
jgi:hypothetical protein